MSSLGTTAQFRISSFFRWSSDVFHNQTGHVRAVLCCRCHSGAETTEHWRFSNHRLSDFWAGARYPALYSSAVDQTSVVINVKSQTHPTTSVSSGHCREGWGGCVPDSFKHHSDCLIEVISLIFFIWTLMTVPLRIITSFIFDIFHKFPLSQQQTDCSYSSKVTFNEVRKLMLEVG